MSIAQSTPQLAQKVLPAGTWSGDAELCELDYADRFLRRKRLVTQNGLPFIVDLEQTTSLNDGDALVLGDGTTVEIRAAAEELYQVVGENLVQLAWHVGNRHTPCQIGQGCLFIQKDKVIGHMLEHLGAEITLVIAPFTPEGGAYGHGRTHSHEHGASAHHD